MEETKVPAKNGAKRSIVKKNIASVSAVMVPGGYKIVGLKNFKTGKEIIAKYGHDVFKQYVMGFPFMKKREPSSFKPAPLGEGELIILYQHDQSVIASVNVLTRTIDDRPALRLSVRVGDVIESKRFAEIIKIMKLCGARLVEAIGDQKKKKEQEKIVFNFEI
jgi:hypothetical protein